MISELEQNFYDTFGIEPEYYCTYEKVAANKLEYECTDNDLEKCKKCKDVGKKYPEITAEKLLEMICIWNYTMPYIDYCIIPINYLGLKSVVLDTMIRYSEIKYEFDIDALKYQIKQLFKEEE